MPTLELRVDPAPLEPRTAHAVDRALLERASAREQGLLRVYRLCGEVVSLGRWHRRPAGAPGLTLHRRATGGRVAASGDGFAHVALYLPHRAALVGADPGALAPEQVLNRSVRGLLGALESLGIPALYPGRDLITVGGRALAVLGFEVAASGATLVDALLSLDRDQSALPHRLERCDPDGVVAAPMLLPDEVTSVAREAGRVPRLDELLAAIGAAMTARLGVVCDDRRCDAPLPAPVGDAADEATWLDQRRARDDLPIHARLPAMLGTVEADVALGADGTIAAAQIVGDLLAPSAAVADAEAGLRGCSPDAAAVEAVLRRSFGPPAFLLGVRSLRTLAEAIAEAAGCSAAPADRSSG